MFSKVTKVQGRHTGSLNADLPSKIVHNSRQLLKNNVTVVYLGKAMQNAVLMHISSTELFSVFIPEHFRDFNNWALIALDAVMCSWWFDHHFENKFVLRATHYIKLDCVYNIVITKKSQDALCGGICMQILPEKNIFVLLDRLFCCKRLVLTFSTTCWN